MITFSKETLSRNENKKVDDKSAEIRPIQLATLLNKRCKCEGKIVSCDKRKDGYFDVAIQNDNHILTRLSSTVKRLQKELGKIDFVLVKVFTENPFYTAVPAALWDKHVIQ